MIVFGDQALREDPRQLLAEIRCALSRAARAGRGILRHDLVVTALIDAGQLAQGLADAEMEVAGCDRRSPVQNAAMALVMTLARAVGVSWVAGFEGGLVPPDHELDELSACALPDRITVRQPEGFAHYALYPEAYFEAGRDLPPGARVIGLRSIGTSLAAMAAAGAGADVPMTLRPVGHPFRREFRLDAALLAELTGDATIPAYAIVDEGPGLSGSSMNGLADVLEHQGVPPGKVVFLPGHAGPLGAEAAPRHRRRWAVASRRVVAFDRLVAPRLASAVADLTGPPLRPLQDLAGGRWRACFEADEAGWPPVHAGQERRKFLLRSRSGEWLLKFAGLGRLGANAFRRAERLHQAGFAPQPLGVRLGFLVERWQSNAAPLRRPDDRPALMEVLGRYLGLRANLRARPDAGAGLAALASMAGANIAEALGGEAAARWRGLYGDGSGLPPPQRVDTDNRLHVWEWLRGPDGRLIKTDGLDHSRSHDLIGCQDIAWDLAGAVVEFHCSAGEVEQLIEGVERAGARPVNRPLLHWLQPIYLAFQTGLWTMAAAQAEPSEAVRISALLAGYRDGLRQRLGLAPDVSHPEPA